MSTKNATAGFVQYFIAGAHVICWECPWGLKTQRSNQIKSTCSAKAKWILNIIIWSFRKKEMGAAVCCSGPGRCRKELGRLSISIIMPAPQLVSCIMGIVSMIMMVVKMRMFEIKISIIMSSAPQLQGDPRDCVLWFCSDGLKKAFNWHNPVIFRKLISGHFDIFIFQRL